MQTNPEELRRMVEEATKQIRALEKSLAETEKRAKSYEEHWSQVYDQSREMREEARKLQHEYEQLRIQKGGFGFKMLLFSGFCGFVTAAFLCLVYVRLLRPVSGHEAAFTEFAKAHQFDYELQLSRGEFQAVESSLREKANDPAYKIIAPEIAFAEKMVSAAGLYFSGQRSE
jgi:DNA repair exonuclease SbcCD ATPase subunit